MRVTPKMIAAAWTVVRSRFPAGRVFTGPGPGFAEAIEAALDAAEPGPIDELLACRGRILDAIENIDLDSGGLGGWDEFRSEVERILDRIEGVSEKTDGKR